MGIEPGTLIAKRYRVERALGKGGMGEVFAAENIRTGRAVAIKVLRAESKAKASAIERFRREARAAGSIHSDNVTQVLDVEDDPEHGIVLVFELLKGESLVDRLKRTGPLGFDELWPVVESVWMGLADAHAAGVVHRDLKPSNVFLQRSQGRMQARVKILDFGISKLPKKITTQSLTQVGQSLGTFSFMPPEQIGKAKMVDHRADIYAATTLIYQALSGQLPYQAKNVVAMMELKSRTEPRTLGEALKHAVDQALEDFIARGLSRNPDDRFQTALEALEWWRKLRPPGVRSAYDAEAAALTDDDEVDGEDAMSRAKTRVRPLADIMEQARALQGPPSTTDGQRTDRFVRSRGGVGVHRREGGAPASEGAEPGPRTRPLSPGIHGAADDSPAIEIGGAVPMTAAEAQAAQGQGPNAGARPLADPASYLSAPPGAVGVVRAPPAAPQAGARASGYPAEPSFDAQASDMRMDAASFDGRGSDMRLDAMHPQGTTGPQQPVPVERGAGIRVALGLILGAVGLMLLGFGIVALAIRLLR